MSNYIRVLLIGLAGAVILQAAPVAEQPCIERGIQITSPNDTAIMRARSSLEIPLVRLLMITALHFVKSDLPPTLAPCMILKDARESGAGANLTYVYRWRSESLAEFNFEVTFHCDTAGRIDHIRAEPSSNQPFLAFGNYLR